MKYHPESDMAVKIEEINNKNTHTNENLFDYANPDNMTANIIEVKFSISKDQKSL